METAILLTTAAAARAGGEPGAAAEAPTAMVAGVSSEGTGPVGHCVPQDVDL